jgi:hypothetical protein
MFSSSKPPSRKTGKRSKRRNPQSQPLTAVLAGGRDRNLGLTFSPKISFPHMNKRLSPYNQIRIQGSVEVANLFTSSTTVPTYSGTVFALSALSNYTAYTAVFDQYMIEAIEMWIFTGADGVDSISSSIGIWNSAVDYDDGNTPTTISQVSDKQTNVASSIQAGHYHKWCPQFALGAYTGSFGGFSAGRGWIDCASPTVQHYGLKTSCAATPVNPFVFSSIVRYTIAFRGAGIS